MSHFDLFIGLPPNTINLKNSKIKKVLFSAPQTGPIIGFDRKQQRTEKFLCERLLDLNNLMDSCENSFQVSDETEKFLCEKLLDQNQPISERFRALFSLRNLRGSAPRNALILATRDSSNLLAHEAAFALGQMQDADAIPALESVLNDLSLHPIVRHEAAEALGAIGLESNVSLLKKSLLLDPAQEVRETCELALSRIEELKNDRKSDDSSPFLSVDPAAPAYGSSFDELREVLLNDEKGMYARYAALFALRNHGGEEAISAIIESLSAHSALLRHEVAYVLGQLQNKTASDVLSRILRDVNEHPMVRHEAAEALGSIADGKRVALLKEFAEDPEPIVAQSCEVALSMLEFERSGKSFEYYYGVNKETAKKKNINDAKSQLAPPLAELMKMLFNVETYRVAMMEFEINMSEMPLGKLSKSNIQKGFEALTEIQNLLNSDTHNSSVKEGLIVDASNQFFTMIPSIHPHVIRDEDDFKSKLKMLEALQDIEIASRLVGFDGDDDDSLDVKYKKLQCDIAPLPRDSDDSRLIEKYLQTTHGPTHTDWALELEEVFSLERDGEVDKFAPYREKLKNRLLLWHGSRLTNFVGILSQGLRIAPPEAPTTGYMFGKGIYFADLVSKSAQYCNTDKKNPVGLMLLSEVALGEVYELKQAKYMDKPPKGKHSTKGLGKKVPEKSEHVKWRDEVVVPCGKPVSSNVQASELMYNEYIVYNTAQVKMQFLLKVRFRHKR